MTEFSPADFTSYIPKSTGIRYYVAKDGNDSSDGSINSPFLTIAHALLAVANGDSITVGTGTYDESGLDLDHSGLELILEPGTILQDSGDGNILTISAFGCHVVGVGNVRLDPTGGATGVLISGNFAYV